MQAEDHLHQVHEMFTQQYKAQQTELAQKKDDITVAFVKSIRGSNLINVHREFKEWDTHIEQLEGIPEFHGAAVTIKKIMLERKDKHFEVDIYCVYEILRVDIDQKRMSAARRSKFIKLTLLYFKRYCERRSLNVEDNAELWLVHHIQDEERDIDYFAYWKSKSLDWLPLALFAKSVGHAAMDEADVERQVTAEARIFTAKRTALGCEQRNAEMHLLLNYDHYFDKPEAEARQIKRVRRHELSQQKAEKLYAQLDSELSQ